MKKETKEKFVTGAVRDTHTGKPRFDLIPPKALKRVADLYARGAENYGERNWEKGIPMSRCYASLLRHAFSFGQGDITEDHLAAVVWNAMAIMHFEEEMNFQLWDMPSLNKHKSAQEFVKVLKEHGTQSIQKTKKTR